MKKQSKYSIDDRLFSNLEKFRSIDNQEDWIKVRERMGFQSESRRQADSKRRNPLWYWSAAATIIILLGVGWLTGRNMLAPPRMVVATSAEMKEEVRLPDGSLVSLNRGSELSYPEKFGRKSRVVSFSGEGFFEVARNPEKPFVIQISDQAGVEVLGTKFNINAVPGGNSVKVHVVEGRVAFYSSQTPDTRTILTQDEQAVLQSGGISRGKTVDQNFLSWKTGVLSFDQERITTVLEELGRYYDRQIILKNPDDEDIRFTSVIDNQDLESVLDELHLVLGLEHKTEGKKVTLYRPN
jgi:transmembrane sensor